MNHELDRHLFPLIIRRISPVPCYDDDGHSWHHLISLQLIWGHPPAVATLK